MVNEPEDNTLISAEKTLRELRLETEREIAETRNSLARTSLQLQSKYNVDIQKLSLDGLYSIERYRKSMQEKYQKLVEQGLVEESNMEKAMEDSLAKYSKELIQKEYQERKYQFEKEAKDHLNFEKRMKIERIQNENEIAKYEENLDRELLQAELEQERLGRSGAYENQIQLNNMKIASLQEEQKIQVKGFKDLLKQKEKEVKKQGTKQAKEQWKQTKKQIKKEFKERRKQIIAELKEAGATNKEILQAQADGGDKKAQAKLNAAESLGNVTDKLLNGWSQVFEGSIKSFQEYQGKINVRLQGTSDTFQSIEKKLKGSIGSTPFIKTQKLLDNVVKATEQGIAFNVEQRSFLGTVSEKIAATFDAFDSNLSRIIRLQQADSTAARLGMEASLTSFFNSTFQDSSYLASGISDTVSQNLIEATSQMSADQAISFEYQVQKWLGSLSSVGFSDQAVTAIAEGIGNLGSGNINALSSSGEIQNLIVMAATRAGMSYSDLLIDGLDESSTNALLANMVDYLQEIAQSDNKVVKSQYAQIFGMNVSDLTAVNNIGSSIKSISDSMLGYGDAMGELYSQVGDIASRMSMGELLDNVMDNVNYSIASTIGGNPALYALWEVTSMIEDLTGGIALPTIGVFGNMVDLNTTVTNLMRTGIVGVSTLGSIGQIISGISNTFNPTGMLSKLGIDKTGDMKTTSRGSGLGRKKLKKQMSQSTHIGNSSGDEIYDSSVTAANDSTDKTIKQKKEESTDMTLNDMHEYLLRVFDPKITDIEKLVAQIAGYKLSDMTFKSWGDFKNNDGEEYSGQLINLSDKVQSVTSTSALMLSLLNYVSDSIIPSLTSIKNNELGLVNNGVKSSIVKIGQNDADSSVDKITKIEEASVGIYNLLQAVVKGESSLTVKQNISTNPLGVGTPGL